MDLRIEKTYRALMQAFAELLEERRYEEITVAMLCDRAMIRRTTFYKHFADKAAFFVFFIEGLRIDMLRRGEERTDASGQEICRTAEERAIYESHAVLEGLLDFLLEHEAIVDNIIESVMMGTMLTSIVDKVADAIYERYSKLETARENCKATLKQASDFAAGGIVRLFQAWWLDGHAKADEQQLLEVAGAMLNSVMFG